MKSPVTPEFLLQGAYFALEQCGLLLRDALRRFVGDAYASTIALSAFAREELGREKILLELRTRVQAGEAITLEKIKSACKEHVIKQDHGVLSMTLQAQRDTGTGKLPPDIHTSARMSNPLPLFPLVYLRVLAWQKVGSRHARRYVASARGSDSGLCRLLPDCAAPVVLITGDWTENRHASSEGWVGSKAYATAVCERVSHNRVKE